jgi:hypothetical protein
MAIAGSKKTNSANLLKKRNKRSSIRYQAWKRICSGSSVEEYKKIVKPKSNLFQFIQTSPLSKTLINIERDKSLGRDIEL